MFDQLKAMKSLAGLMGNAGELKLKFEAAQRELAAKSVTADAGGGAVRVTVTGELKVTEVHLDPRLLPAATGETTDADRAMVERLIVEATNTALENAQQLIRNEMASVTAGMNLPGVPGLDKLMGG